MEKIVSLAKRRGFIFHGSEIYGGLTGTWDYGPLGVELKNNLKKEFWRAMVYEREDTVGLDAAIMMNPKVWEASGHTNAFTDPLVECKTCHERFRADHPEEIEEHTAMHKRKSEEVSWTEPRQFNLLVEAKLGAVEGEKTTVYLRGEITQGVHVNFKNVLDSTHRKLPFGIAQIGKAFRNEITPGNLTFRSREFEQMELQYYVKPEEAQAGEIFGYWKQQRMQWYTSLGMDPKHLRFREHAPDERAHYARAAWDIEYDSPFGGWKEMEGIHHRGDWDMRRHTQFSAVDLSYYDEEKKERYTPWVIETSGGVDRAILFFLLDAYQEEESEKGTRVVLKLHSKLAPLKAAVFPLVANKPQLVEKAREIFKDLKSKNLNVAWDDRGNIGKRYWSQDEIGTPWCVTIDYQTLEDGTVTVRDRDTTKQERIATGELSACIKEKMGYV
ncbi:MAG: glycine--tRNA ligase [Candidatus Sungbacteria bacterium]|nr:glycine--tRNA ligase [Candidatus Sungbacteria bacterium]